jgi:hypothetical protein
MRPALLRISSLVFVLTGVLIGIKFWLLLAQPTRSPLDSLTLSLASDIFAALGFVLWFTADSAPRQWLGWIGFILVLSGLVAQSIVDIIELQHQGLPLSAASSWWPLVPVQNLGIYGGLVFLALGLPNITRFHVWQKAVLATLGIWPYITTALVAVHITYEQEVIVDGSILSLLWLGFGATLWGVSLGAPVASV